MRKFITELFSNRFGIVLATLNVCYLVSRADNPIRQPLDMPFFCANFPSGAAVFLSLKGIGIFLFDPSYAARFLVPAFFIFFVTLQWLFVAWTAKTLAARIRRSKLR